MICANLDRCGQNRHKIGWRERPQAAAIWGAPMLVFLFDRWSEWPAWARWTSGIGAIVLLDSVRAAWGERDFVAGVAETFAAYLLYYGGLAGALAAGAWIGSKIAKASSKDWLGWLIGIVTVAVLWLGLANITDHIPGVSWRMKAMGGGDCHAEWDGWSNPVVCDESQP